MILNEYGTIANKEWEKLDKRFTQIELDEYILMPNHMHGFIIISNAIFRRTQPNGPLTLKIDTTRLDPR